MNGFDSKLFSAALLSHTTRKGLSLRVAAASSGVSVSTLSRIARGEVPDVDTFAKLVKWLEIDANVFCDKPAGGEMTEPEKYAWLQVCLQDCGAPHDLISAIITIVKLVAQGEQEK